MERIPFDPREVAEFEIIPPRFPGMPPGKAFKTPITPKENMRLVYQKQLPLWIPSSADTRLFIPRIDPDNVARCLIMEANPLKPEEMVGGKDKHGIDWVYVPQVGGSMVRPGNPVLQDVNDWKKIVSFPDIESWDWEGSAKSNADYVNTDKFLIVWIMTGFFERLISLMDFDNAALALIDEDQKDAIHELFDALADLYCRMVDKYQQYFNVDALCLHDDWGSQRAPFFSLDTVMEMIVPHLKKVVDHCHSRGLFFDMHSCGKNELLVPAYIAAGVDSWSGQPMNDKAMLYEKYGDKIILGIDPKGSIDMTKIGTVPMATPEEAIQSAKEFVQTYAPNYANKPVICGTYIGPAEFAETLYVESRKALNP